MEPTQIAMIFALIISVIIHEMAHGYAAEWQGDPTARLQGRLSPNPLVHLDPFMSVILPGLLLVYGFPILFGAAKPVPYNPYNFNNQKWGEAIVAAAGPLSNIAIAIVFAVIVRFSEILTLNEVFIQLAFGIIMMNIFLALFNLLPIPPLDGSRILPRFLPFSLAMKYENFRRYMSQYALQIILVLFLLIFITRGAILSPIISPIVSFTETFALFLVGV